MALEAAFFYFWELNKQRMQHQWLVGQTIAQENKADVNQSFTETTQKKESLMEKNNLTEKFCSYCGAVIKKEAEVCPKCGIRQPDSVIVNTDKAVKSGKQSCLIAAIVIGGFLLLLVLASGGC
jgi:ribosomal protein L40E